MISAAWLQISASQHVDKFFCHGKRYTEFPATDVPAETELIECQFQFFTKFPPGAFRNKRHLLAIDVSYGSLETLSKETFYGANSLLYLNVSGSNLHGTIHRDIFCYYTPNLMSIDLSHNPNYVFTFAPFECLRHLTELRINNTVQNCDPDTVRWIEGLPPGTVIGNECNLTEKPTTTPPGFYST